MKTSYAVQFYNKPTRSWTVVFRGTNKKKLLVNANWAFSQTAGTNRIRMIRRDGKKEIVIKEF